MAFLARGGKVKRSSARLISFLPPLVWTAFLWLYVVVASDAAFQPFYVLVRGRGAVLYPSSIDLLSSSADLDLFLAVSVAVLAMNLTLVGRRWRSRAWMVVLCLPFVGCLAAFAGTSSALFLSLLGLFFALSVVAGAQIASEEAGVSAGRVLSYFVLFVVAVLAALAAAASVRWVTAGFDGSVPLAGWSWGPAYVGLQLIGLLDPVLPQLALLFFFAWALRLALSPLLREPGESERDRPAEGETPSPLGEALAGRRLSLALLGVGVLLAALVAAYPYLPAVNPSSELVGVDTYFCYSHVLDSQPFLASAQGACAGSLNAYAIQRLGAVEMLRGLAYLSGSNYAGLEVAPLVLSVLLTVSTYLLVLEGTGDGLAAGVSALLASVSPEIIAGLNGGLLANWLAISVAFLFFASLLRALRTRQPGYILLSYVVLVALLFVHPWTWALTLVILGVFLSVSLLEALWRGDLRSKRLEAGMLVSILAVGLAADAIRSSLPEGSGLATALATLIPGLELSNVAIALTNLRLTFVTFLLGGFADPIWFVLGLLGILAIPSLNGRFAKLLLGWVGAVSVGVILLGPASIDTLQARVIYDVPLQIFASLGLVAIIRPLVRGLQDGAGLEGRWAGLVVVLVLIGVLGLLLGFALDNAGFLFPPAYLR